jgi:hypothetical protein
MDVVVAVVELPHACRARLGGVLAAHRSGRRVDRASLLVPGGAIRRPRARMGWLSTAAESSLRASSTLAASSAGIRTSARWALAASSLAALPGPAGGCAAVVPASAGLRTCDQP